MVTFSTFSELPGYNLSFLWVGLANIKKPVHNYWLYRTIVTGGWYLRTTFESEAKRA